MADKTIITVLNQRTSKETDPRLFFEKIYGESKCEKSENNISEEKPPIFTQTTTQGYFQNQHPQPQIDQSSTFFASGFSAFCKSCDGVIIRDVFQRGGVHPCTRNPITGCFNSHERAKLNYRITIKISMISPVLV